MKKWLSLMMTASLLLYPFAGFAQDYGSQTSKQQAPPVAQTLVREGDFAIKLAAELKLGNPANEAAAEDMLARAGVSPLNGWLSDYPITPEIIGQIGDSITAAGSAGMLPMSAGEATKGLYSLASEMNLPTPAGQSAGTTVAGTTPSGAAPEENANPTVVNNYYYDEGPPIISYYPPPADYVYLYDWVPYPAFWFGFWFPGFYICHNFTHTVFVTNVGFVTRTGVVSNRIIDPATRTVTAIDPVVRTSTGTVRPMTALRTGSGQLFRNTADMRRGVTLSGVSPVRTGTSAIGSAAGRGGFTTPEARKSAQAIYSRSVQNMSGRNGGTTVRSSGSRNAAPGSAGRSYSAPTRGSEGWGGSRGSSSRSYYNSPFARDSGGYNRSYAAPSSPSRAYINNGGGFGRSYTAPSAPQRSFSSIVNRGGGVSGPSTFRGMGWGRRM
jgi:hypothetical protein